MGYTHGKRGGGNIAPTPKHRYLEDRVAALENVVNGLLRLAHGSLDREQVDTQRSLEKVLLEGKLRH